MAFPSDVLLPLSVKYFGFIDSKIAYNPHWDITWSFSYALTGSQHGFCTFLTASSTFLSAFPGQYLGYLNNTATPNGALAIAFDSTGLFALSSATRNGVSINNVKPNSLIMRIGNNLIYNEYLSSFNISEITKTFKTIRFRLSNGGTKLYIDHKTDSTDYKNLTFLSISSFIVDQYPQLYPSITFSSPISSSLISPSKFWLKNFHTQGNISPPTYDVADFVSLSSSKLTMFNTMSSII
jgi:hypothetical protein